MDDSNSTDLPDRLSHACKVLNLPIAPEQHAQLLDYVAQMQKWNRTYNLTAVRDPGQILVTHVFDSLAVIGPLDQWFAKRSLSAPLLYDVGSGGGLPAVVLAVMRPYWRVFSIDAVEKKTAFVRQVSARLKAPNLQVLHARIETLDSAECDIVISRAFASLPAFAKLAGRHVNGGGSLLAMKGKIPDEEIVELHQSALWRIERIQPLMVPELDAQRCLLWMCCREGTQ